MYLTNDQNEKDLGAIFAKAAIVVGVLGAVFYAGFITASSGVPNFGHAYRVAPVLQLGSTVFQTEPAPQKAWIYFPDNYVNQGKNEDGSVMTYEHD